MSCLYFGFKFPLIGQTWRPSHLCHCTALHCLRSCCNNTHPCNQHGFTKRFLWPDTHKHTGTHTQTGRLNELTRARSHTPHFKSFWGGGQNARLERTGDSGTVLNGRKSLSCFLYSLPQPKVPLRWWEETVTHAHYSTQFNCLSFFFFNFFWCFFFLTSLSLTHAHINMSYTNPLSAARCPRRGRLTCPFT